VEDHSISGFGVRRSRDSLGICSTEHSRFLRAAGLHGTAGKARRAGRALRKPNGRHLCAARDHQRIPQESDPELGISAENTFIYMRGYPSKQERDKRLKAAHDDPEFGEVVTKQEQNPQTRLIVKAHNIDMVPSGPYTAIAIAK